MARDRVKRIREKDIKSKYEKYRLGLSIIATIVGIVGITLCNVFALTSLFFTLTVSVISFVAGGLGLISSGVRAIKRNMAIIKNRDESLRQLNLIKSGQGVIKNYEKLALCNIKLCRLRGYAFYGRTRSSLDGNNGKIKNRLAEEHWRKAFTAIEGARGIEEGKSHSPKGTKKYEKIVSRTAKTISKYGQLSSHLPEIEKLKLVDGTEVEGINQIYSGYADTKKAFMELVSKTADTPYKGFGMGIRIESADSKHEAGFKNTYMQFTDVENKKEYFKLAYNEIEKLAKEYGEEHFFPVKVTVYNDLNKTSLNANGEMRKYDTLNEFEGSFNSDNELK